MWTLTSAFQLSQLDHFQPAPLLLKTDTNSEAMAFFTRSLQDLPKITVNDVGRIIQEACRTLVTKKEKDFKLYVSSYTNYYEGKIWTCKLSMFLY